MAYPFTQKITGNTKTEISNVVGEHGSMVIANNHATVDVTIDLYITSQLNSAITATDIYAAETEVKSTSSVTLTVDNGSGSASDAANDELLDEQVWKSDGTLFGTCTTVSSTTSLIFSGGLNNAITDNDILHVGTRFFILNNVVIPNGASLKLEANEFKFNRTAYNMYIISNSSDGNIDIITR